MVLAVIISLVLVIGLSCYLLIRGAYRKEATTEQQPTTAPEHHTAISFKRGLELTDLPVVTFYQGSEKFHFILDTGCSMSSINPAMLDRFQYLETPHTKGYYGVDGKLVRSKIIAAEITYQDKTYGEYFQVLNNDDAFKAMKKEHGVTITGLLGNSFFETYKYLIDFSEMVAYSQK